MWAILVAMALLLMPVGAMASSGDKVLFGIDYETGMQTSYVDATCVVDDVLYIKSDSAIYQWKMGDEEPSLFLSQETLQPENADQPTEEPLTIWAFTGMFGMDGKLMLLHRESGILHEATPSGFVKTEMKIDTSTLAGASGDPNQDTNLLEMMIVYQDSLFLLARPSEMEWQTQQLCTVDLKSGKITPITESGLRITSMTPYVEGKMLLVMEPTEGNSTGALVQVFDIASGKFEGAAVPFGENVWNVSSLYYDADSEYIYYAQNTRVMRMKLGGATEPVNYLAQSVYSSRSPGAMMSGKLVATGYEGIFVVSVDPAEMPSRTLRVAGDWGNYNGLAKFLDAHPDVAVDRMDIGIYNIESLTTAMTGGAAPDVFTYGSYSDLYQLFDKGYVLDMSSDVRLMEKVEALYPHVQAVAMRNGKLYGYPMSMEMGLWAYDAKRFEELGIEYPETFADLLELLADWEDDYQEDADNLPLVYEYMLNKDQLFSMILQQYVVEFEKPDEPISFNTPQFREVMTALERAPLQDSYEQENASRTIVMASDYIGEPVMDTYGSFWSARSDRPKTLMLPPKLAQGCEQFASSYMQLYVVNAQTQNPELAIDYINAMAENLEKQYQYIIDPSKNEPVESPYYEENVKSIEAYIEMLESQQVEPENAREHEEELRNARANLEDTDNWRWEIAPGTIEEYRALAPSTKVMTSMLLYNEATGEEFQKIIRRYQEKQINLDQLIRELDQKAQMIFLEGR